MLNTVIANAGWLGLIQLLNYILPVLTLPVVTRSFGPSIFGTLAAINAYATYVGIIVNYGFGFAGPRSVATSRANPKELSKAISAIIGSQAILAIAASSIYFAILIFLPLSYEYKLASIALLVQVLANSLSPQWIFVGLESVGAFAISQFAFRVAATGIIVYSIRGPQDILLYVAVNATSSLLITVVSFAILRRLGVDWRTPTVRNLVSALREAFGLFLSSIAINLYTTTSVLIVALILGPAAAGPFALADRLRQATSGVLGPITTAVYPVICRATHRTKTDEERSTIQLFFRLIVAVSAVLSIGLLCFAAPVVKLVGGDSFAPAINVLRLMAFLPVVISLSNILGVQTMIPMRMDRYVAYVVTLAAGFGSITLTVFTSFWGLTGAAVAILLVECFVTLLFGILVHRRRNIMSLFFA